MRQPKKDVSFRLVMDDDTRQKLSKLADQEYRSDSSMVRSLIQRAFDALIGKDEPISYDRQNRR